MAKELTLHEAESELNSARGWMANLGEADIFYECKLMEDSTRTSGYEPELHWYSDPTQNAPLLIRTPYLWLNKNDFHHPFGSNLFDNSGRRKQGNDVKRILTAYFYRLSPEVEDANRRGQGGKGKGKWF